MTCDAVIQATTKDVVIPSGPITRARAKRMKEQLNILVCVVQETKKDSSIFEDSSEYVTLLQLEDQDTRYFESQDPSSFKLISFLFSISRIKQAIYVCSPCHF